VLSRRASRRSLGVYVSALVFCTSRLDATTRDTGATFGFAIALILADVTTAFRLWMKTKPVRGLSEIGKDPPQIRPIRDSIVAIVSVGRAASVTRCEGVRIV